MCDQFAAEDCRLHDMLYPLLQSDIQPADCADTSIIRSRSRQELLYTRSQIVIAAKAFSLEAIDMVSLLVHVSSIWLILTFSASRFASTTRIQSI